MPPVDLPPDSPVVMAQAPVPFDLADVSGDDVGLDLKVVKPRCPLSSGHEIVVCAPDPEANRLRPLPDTYVTQGGLPRAEVDLGGGASLDLHVDSAAMPDGSVSNRVMVGVKVAF
ncbi:hypothetical protein [Novosphingobium malaysiense]|uniref:Uncharacterized protein n=1 Tax=Novosphingobium malaysiense TaxID=1348853 RepID=A0A0B1ZJK3_9SPHN|nr:hypothetical protein [Novosphingobium malaysiense]KHK89366.1 hypothetical protein LK12_19705 [Novosphingobium malaysiense]